MMQIKKIVTINKRKEFQKMKNTKKRLNFNSFALCYLQEDIPDVKWAFITTRKLGKAHFRNKCRRRIKACLQRFINNSLEIPNGMYLFIIKSSAGQLNMGAIEDDMGKAINLIKKKPNIKFTST